MVSRARLHALLPALLSAAVGASCAPAVQELTTEIRPDELDDLAVVSIAASQPFPRPGEPVQLRAIVENRAARTVSAVQVALRERGRQVASTTIGLPAGAEVPVTFDWSADAAGVHTPEVVIVDSAALREADRADNSRQLEILVAEPPSPGVDLEIERLDVSSDERALSISARNNGREAVTVPVRILDRELRLARLVGPIEGGTSRTVVMPWPAGRSIRGVKVELNPRHRLAEPNPENNLTVMVPFLPAAAARDLQVEAVSIHSTRAESGRSRLATFSFSVVNAGTSGADPFRIRVTPRGSPPAARRRPL